MIKYSFRVDNGEVNTESRSGSFTLIASETVTEVEDDSNE